MGNLRWVLEQEPPGALVQYYSYCSLQDGRVAILIIATRHVYLVLTRRRGVHIPIAVALILNTLIVH